MKKLLAILGTLSIGASGATLVVACNGPKTQTKTQDSTPENRQNKPTTETKKDKDSDKSKKQDPKEEKHEKKPSTDEHKKPSELVSYSWNSAFKDNITGEDIDLALGTVVIQNNKHYKFFKDSSSSLVADLFDDKIADQVKDAKIRWEKIQKIAKEKAKDKEEAEVLHELVNFSDSLEKELKPLAEKLFQEAKDKEFLTNASNATEDYFKTLDKVKDLETWAKAKIEKNARVAKEKAKDKEEAEVLHELVNFSDSLEKELKPLAEKLFQEAKDKEFLTNASNATEDYFKTLDKVKDLETWAKAKIEKNARVAKEKAKDKEEAEVLHELVNFSDSLEKELKPLAEKLFQEAKDKEFLTNASNATEDYFKTLDKVKDLETWAKAKIEKNARVAKEKAKDKEEAEVLHELVNFSDSLEKELKPLAEKLFQEAKDKEFLTNASNATEDYFKTLDKVKDLETWAKAKIEKNARVAKEKAKDKEEAEVLHELVNFSDSLEKELKPLAEKLFQEAKDKEFLTNASNATEDYFKTLDKVKDLEAWAKAKIEKNARVAKEKAKDKEEAEVLHELVNFSDSLEKELKPLAEKLFQEAKDKEFLTNASNATEDYFKTLDKVKDLETWAKAKIEKNARVAKEKAKDKEEAEVLHELVNFSDSLEKELKPLAEKLFQEAKDKEFLTNASNATEDYFKTLDKVKDLEAWAKAKIEKNARVAKEKAKDKEEAEVLHELVNFSDSLEKELKPLAEKLFQEAKDKEFLTNASNATEDYFKTLDKVKDLETWAKAKIEKNARVAKEKAKDKEEAEVLHELVNFSDSLEKELKPLAEKLFQEAKDKEFLTNASNATEDYFKTLDKVKDLEAWAKAKIEKNARVAKEKAKDKEEAEVLHELVNFSDSLEKELKPLAEKLFQEAKDKEFLTNASNATEDYFKTLDTSKEVNEWKHEKERFNEIITNINKKVEELTGSGNSLESVITDVESNLRNYKDSIKDLKNSKEFWKYEMWNYWLEDLLKTLKRH